MSTGKNRYLFIVAIFSLIAVSILGTAIWMLGGQHKTFEKKFPAKCILTAVNGLKIGDNIWLSGVKIGIIQKIELTEDAHVLVVMSIENKSRKYIHKDSKIKLTTDGLIGNKVVVVYGGTKTSPVINDNEYLEEGNTSGTADMLSVLDSSSKNLLVITGNLKEVSQRILSGKGAINTLLDDPMISADLKSSMTSTRSAMAAFNSTADRSKQMMIGLLEFSNRLNKEGTLVNSILTDTISYGRLNLAITRLQQTMDTLSAFSDNLKKASDALDKGNNNVTGTLLYNDTTANQLKSTISNLDSATHSLKEDLKAIQHNILLRGYFKKQSRKKK